MRATRRGAGAQHDPHRVTAGDDALDLPHLPGDVPNGAGTHAGIDAKRPYRVRDPLELESSGGVALAQDRARADPPHGSPGDGHSLLVHDDAGELQARGRGDLEEGLPAREDLDRTLLDRRVGREDLDDVGAGRRPSMSHAPSWKSPSWKESTHPVGPKTVIWPTGGAPTRQATRATRSAPGAGIRTTRCCRSPGRVNVTGELRPSRRSDTKTAAVSSVPSGTPRISNRPAASLTADGWRARARAMSSAEMYHMCPRRLGGNGSSGASAVTTTPAAGRPSASSPPLEDASVGDGGAWEGAVAAEASRGSSDAPAAAGASRRRSECGGGAFPTGRVSVRVVSRGPAASRGHRIHAAVAASSETRIHRARVRRAPPRHATRLRGDGSWARSCRVRAPGTGGTTCARRHDARRGSLGVLLGVLGRGSCCRGKSPPAALRAGAGERVRGSLGPHGPGKRGGDARLRGAGWRAGQDALRDVHVPTSRPIGTRCANHS